NAFGQGTLVSGNQTLLVDGSSISLVASSASQMKYSKVSVAVTIGLNQNNELPKPIYMQGTPVETASVDPAAGATISAANDASIQLSMPAGAINTSDPVQIYLATAPADRTVLPPPGYSQPRSVLNLEPSGLSFNQRVDLILPNSNHLPDGVDMVIMSLNSTKGIWEIDGVATVTGGV